jgi:hypothetical protein
MLDRDGRLGTFAALLSLCGILSVALALWHRDRIGAATLTRWDEAAAFAAAGLLLHWLDHTLPNDFIATAWWP